MKTIKQILDSHNIKENTKYHNWSYAYEKIVEAMIEFGEQTFKKASSKAYVNGFWDRKDDNLNDKSYTFEDYLKEINDED